METSYFCYVKLSPFCFQAAVCSGEDLLCLSEPVAMEVTEIFLVKK